MDVLKIIFNYLEFKSQIAMISVCTYYRSNLTITNLYDIDEKYLKMLTTGILSYPIFKYVTDLNASNNKKITNVSFMKSLKKLSAYGFDCGITQNGIKGLKLVELNTNNNKKITNVSFMKSLKKLDVWNNSGIDQ